MKSAQSFFHYTIPWRIRWWKKILLFLMLLIVILLFFGIRAYPVVQWSPTVIVKPTVIPLPTVAPYPVNIKGTYPGNEITASGVVVLDADSGIYLYKRNEDMQLSPASTTKIMTALVILDTFKLDDVVTINNPLVNGQMMGLVHGERITIENLLYGALIQSGNDAAMALADVYPGGYDQFIIAMNKKAEDLHLTNSYFVNPAGFDHPNHKMTPQDLARLAMVALTNPIISKMVAIPQITVSDVTHTMYHKLTNVNQLVGKVPGVAGVKTGWTAEAGENLVTYVDRNGRHVVFVVLHSRDRFGDTVKLIDWVFNAYTWEDYNSTK